MAAEVNKPDFSYQWSSGGSIVAPSNVKIQTGWTAEVPPFQWENYLQNRQDNAILHLFQKGISEWDALSNYYFTTSGTRSYVQGSDGQIYVAVQDSIGQNPTTDVSDTYWKVAFADNSTALTTTTGDARYTQRSNNLSDLSNIATSRSNLGVQNAVVAGIAGVATNLKFSTTGLSALVTLTADAVCVKNTTNEQVVVNAVSLSINLAASGANGLDTGTSAASTFYSVWVIWNGTTTAGLLSTSATSPVMPSGYTHKARVGWVPTDATANKYPLTLNGEGNSVQYTPTAATNLTLLPVLAAGVQGTVGSVGQPINGFVTRVPSTAKKIRLAIWNSAVSTIQVSPTTNMTIQAGSPCLNLSQATAVNLNLYGELLIKGWTVYYAGNAVAANNTVSVYGWEDNL